ncbi:MAG: Ig-like domain-containing protein, partial [Verrucomicrobia bacterium]|nr:Ig-like domain-containing protein [Verrucomicrobiota bacterium]
MARLTDAMKKTSLTILALLMTVCSLLADTTPHVLSSGSFSQSWSNAGQITANDNWSGVPSITGYLGDLSTASPAVTDVDPRTVLTSNGVVDVIANQLAPNTNNSGGVAEFAITNPVVALQGSGTADAPYISIFLNTTGVPVVIVSYKLRDIDGNTDNAVQQVALQYRIGSSGNFTDVPAGYVADASSGPNLATLETNINVTLPEAVVGQALVEVRIITTNALGADEWIGIDDIVVSATDTNAPLASTFAPADNATGVSLSATPSITFNEAVKKGAGNLLIKRSSDESVFEIIDVTSTQVVVAGSTMTITPTAAFANTTGYYIEIPAGAIQDIANNNYAGISGNAAWNFTTLAADIAPPVVSSFSPLDEATGVANSATPTITFNEAVKNGTGNILIKNSGGIFDTIAVTSTQVVVTGSTVTITPTTPFVNSTGYYLEIPAGAIEDIAGNDYAGISDPTTWNFTTGITRQAYMATNVTSATGAARPTGGSVSADHYAEGSALGTFAVYSIANFRFNKVDFVLPGSANIDNIVTAEYTLTTNNRTFAAGSTLEFFLTTDQMNGDFTGKTFNA